MRFERRGDLEVVQARHCVALADQDQTMTEPGVAKRAIYGNSVFKNPLRFRNAVLRGQQESFNSEGFRIARRKLQALLQRSQRGWYSAKTKFQFRHPRPTETELGRFGDCHPRGLERFFEFRTRLDR